MPHTASANKDEITTSNIQWNLVFFTEDAELIRKPIISVQSSNSSNYISTCVVIMEGYQ